MRFGAVLKPFRSIDIGVGGDRYVYLSPRHAIGAVLVYIPLPDGFRRHTSGLGEIGRGEVLLVNNQVCVRPSLVGTNDRAQGLWSVALEA